MYNRKLALRSETISTLSAPDAMPSRDAMCETRTWAMSSDYGCDPTHRLPSAD